MSLPDTNLADLDALSTLLGGIDVLKSTERDVNAVDSIDVIISGADRADLKSKDPKTYAKIKEKACAKITTSFKLMSTVDETSAVADLQAIYNINIRLRELQKDLAQNNLQDVFTIFTAWENAARQGRSLPLPSTNAATHVRLLEKYSEISFDNVKKSTAFYMQVGAEYQVENLKWSGEKILSSCEESLREKILESTAALDPIYHGGPVYFWLMMQLVSTTSDHAMRCVIDKINKLKLSDFDGESVLHAVTFLRGAITLLKNNNAVPHDLRTSIFSMMKHCSTQDFVHFVTSLETMSSFPGMLPDTSIEFLLTTFESKYTDLLGSNKWSAKTSSISSQGSSFMAQPPSDSKDDPDVEPICFNCGAVGHKLDTCPKPRDQSSIDRFRKALNRLSSGRSNKKGNRSDKKDKEKDPLHTPPAHGETTTKKFPSGTRYWCGRCKKWGDHLLVDHPTPPSGDAAANNAASSTSGNPQSPPVSSDASSVSSAPAVDADGFTLVQPRSSYKDHLIGSVAHF
jgi:hypothetical protein